MKIAVVYNRESTKVINLFGTPNLEKYGLKAIKRILDALKKGGHQAKAFEGDKNLIPSLESFMPRALTGETPGLVFNLSYGIQGQARYTHVPSILEMVGVPYVGSGPLAHSLALDKVVAKMIFRQNGIPTPNFAVMDTPDSIVEGLEYPLIVKPKNEAVSMGMQIVNNGKELKKAVEAIHRQFNQTILVEEFIEGREINVGIIGNNPAEALVPAEIVFEGDGPTIYTYEDKVKRSGRVVKPVCPANISEETVVEAQRIALKAFHSLGCFDCARIDMRIDKGGNIFVLEINSLPSLGAGGSYVAAAAHAGMDFNALVNRLIDVASSRYFGTLEPMPLTPQEKEPSKLVFDYLVTRRDQIEKSLKEWTNLQSRTSDPLGIKMVSEKMGKFASDIGLRPVDEYSNQRFTWLWETKAGFKDGILLVGHFDTPLEPSQPKHMFRVDPEQLYGEGIGLSRGPMVSMQYALRALRAHRLLRKLPLGILYYSDEGLDCSHSREIIGKAMGQAKLALILRAGNEGDNVVVQRRGQRKYKLTVEGTPRRLGKVLKKTEPLSWLFLKMEELRNLSSRKERIAISATEIKTEAFPMLLPHRVTATILLSYPTVSVADEMEAKMRKVLGKKEVSWKLDSLSDRPPFQKVSGSVSLAKELNEIANKWGIPFGYDSSVWPSVAGLAPRGTKILCGIGPVATDLYTSQESIQRISLIQRTLLLAQFLVNELKK